jgi:hypothetical protein
VPDILLYQAWDETMALLASGTSTAYTAQEVPTHRTLTSASAPSTPLTWLRTRLPHAFRSRPEFDLG